MAKTPKGGWVFVRHRWKPCDVGCHFKSTSGYGCLVCPEPRESAWHEVEEE